MKIIPLSKVCSRIVDCPHETPEWKETGIPVIRNYNLVDGHIDTSNLSFVDEETYLKRVRREVPQKDDVIFSREAPIGNCGIIPDDFKCCLGQRLVLLRANQDICTPSYLITVLQSDYVRQQIEQVSKRGSIVSNFAIEDLKELLIPIIDNQDDVAHLYTLLSDKISNNTEITVLLEKQAKLLYDYWFVQFDFPDENGKPYKSSGGKMVWNEELKREIPDRWEVKPLSAVFDITMGSSPSGASLNENGDGIEFYQGSTDFGNIYPTKRVYTTAPVRFSKAQDVLLSVRAPVGTMNIAMNDCCIGRGLAAIHHFSTMFAWNTMLTFSTYFDIFNNNGTTFGALTSDDLKGQLTAVPPENLINKYHGTTIAIEKQIRNLSKENQELASLRDFLLPMLMNGQVTVKKGETQ